MVKDHTVLAQIIHSVVLHQTDKIIIGEMSVFQRAREVVVLVLDFKKRTAQQVNNFTSSPRHNRTRKTKQGNTKTGVGKLTLVTFAKIGDTSN